MKTVYVCNVSTPDERDDILKLPSTAPKDRVAEPMRALHADPAFGAGSDEEPLPLPRYDGLEEVES
ncbi:MAG TPA: hypothetical protein VG734_08580 [Lacunisphaera sp.]|nr:hypothetical protein [Lacunisphaera sp.]